MYLCPPSALSSRLDTCDGDERGDEKLDGDTDVEVMLRDALQRALRREILMRIFRETGG